MKLSTILKDPKAVIAASLAEEKDAIEAKGNINTVRKLSDWINEYNKSLRKSLEANDIRTARLHLIELTGAVEQMTEHITAISKETGLPDLEG